MEFSPCFSMEIHGIPWFHYPCYPCFHLAFHVTGFPMLAWKCMVSTPMLSMVFCSDGFPWISRISMEFSPCFFHGIPCFFHAFSTRVPRLNEACFFKQQMSFTKILNTIKSSKAEKYSRLILFFYIMVCLPVPFVLLSTHCLDKKI